MKLKWGPLFLVSALGIRQKIKQVRANVFIQFLNVFYSCHVFTFLMFEKYFWNVSLHLLS